MTARFVVIKGEPTAEQLLAIEEFNDYHFAFIDEGGTMRVTEDEGIGKSYETYAVVEGMAISDGYPTVDAEHIAVSTRVEVPAKSKLEINGVCYDFVPAKFRHLADMYNALTK